jgi:hypothetical protein
MLSTPEKELLMQFNKIFKKKKISGLVGSAEEASFFIR